jgi:hypothetical protein
MSGMAGRTAACKPTGQRQQLAVRVAQHFWREAVIATQHCVGCVVRLHPYIAHDLENLTQFLDRLVSMENNIKANRTGVDRAAEILALRNS